MVTAHDEELCIEFKMIKEKNNFLHGIGIFVSLPFSLIQIGHHRKLKQFSLFKHCKLI